MRPTRREKISATSFAQVSQYLRSPHLSTILAKIAPGGRSSGGNGKSEVAGCVPPLVPSPLKMIRLVGVSFRSILLISALNRSSWDRNALAARPKPRRTACCRSAPMLGRFPQAP